MFVTLRVPFLALCMGSFALAGCSSTGDLFGSGGSDVTTSSLSQQAQAPKVDPACSGLAQEIDGLRRDGIVEKIEKAAAKKYKMTSADLTKASRLNKANVDYQDKCSTLPRTAAVAAPAPAAVAATSSAKAAAPAAKAAATKAAPAGTGAAVTAR